MMTIRRRYTMMTTGATEATLDACLPAIRKPRLTKDGALSLSLVVHTYVLPLFLYQQRTPHDEINAAGVKNTQQTACNVKNHTTKRKTPRSRLHPRPHHHPLLGESFARTWLKAGVRGADCGFLVARGWHGRLRDGPRPSLRGLGKRAGGEII